MQFFPAFFRQKGHNILERFSHPSRSAKRFGLLIFLGILCSIGLTYLALTQKLPSGFSVRAIPLLIYLNLAFLIVLIIILVTGFGQIWLKRRRGLFGSRLHGKMMLVFGGLTLFPTLIISISSTLFFDLGLNTWFSDRVQIALSESLKVSEAYIEEHARNIRIDAFRMAKSIDARVNYFQVSPRRLQNVLRLQANVYGLSEAVIFDSNSSVIARSGLTVLLESEPVSREMINQAKRGEILTVSRRNDERLRALIRLESFPGSYLYVGRLVDARVLSYYFKARNAISDFSELEEKRNEFQVSFALFFMLISLLLLIISLRIGFSLATRFTRPIGELLLATNKMRGGDFSARVQKRATEVEFNELGQAFNRMASQIDSQHEKLLRAYSDIDERRRFNEGILTGVSAGVIGLDAYRRIKIFNPSAEKLLNKNLHEFTGKKLDLIIPEVKSLFNQLHSKKPVETELKLVIAGEFRHFLMRLVADESKTKKRNYILTFDDITRLLAMQSKAAWSDVARRIAHEIKNPLTPIQLAAERLKRKFSGQLSNQKETELFIELADTIIRQVESLQRMVDSFSRFAKMPQPVMAACDIIYLCREALLLQKSAWPMISFKETFPKRTIWLECDHQLVMQALTNLLSNAAESIVQNHISSGIIELAVIENKDHLAIEITDNGKGLESKTNIKRFGEAYYTTRPGGTGLGLAIVIKIMEEHKGFFVLCPNPAFDKSGRGALSRLVFPNHLKKQDKQKTDQSLTFVETSHLEQGMK